METADRIDTPDTEWRTGAERDGAWRHSRTPARSHGQLSSVGIQELSPRPEPSPGLVCHLADTSGDRAWGLTNTSPDPGTGLWTVVLIPMCCVVILPV